MVRGNPRVSDHEFIRIVEQHGKGPASRLIGTTERNVFARVNRLRRRGFKINSPLFRGNKPFRPPEYPDRVLFDVPDGIVIAASDPHYWPGPPSIGHRALVKFCRGELADQPAAVVMNGDIVDGATTSRHPPLGWENRPELYQEIEAANERLGEIEMAVPRRCHLVWPAGNHDARFERKLAQVAPEFRKVEGVHLKDHFNACWVPCYTAWINNSVFCIHAYKGGAHHAYNDTLHAGMSTVTGDKHALQVTRFTDLRGDRFGIDTGTLADPWGPQFDYALGKPRNHCSGFIVLTFRDGRLLWPEVVHVLDKEHISFRGQVHHVSENKAPRSPKDADGKAARAKAHDGRDGHSRAGRRGGRSARRRARAG